MDSQENQQRKPALLKGFTLAEVVLFAIIVAIWWFMGEHTVRRFSDVSFLVGVGAMLVGFILYWGTRTATGNFSYQFASSASEADMHERVTRDWKDRFYNERLIVLFIGVGILPIIVGILADKIWG